MEKLMEVTAAASQQVCAMAQEEGFPPRLRIAIQGGGCSGFRYHFAFEETVADDDQRLLPDEPGGLEIVVDPISALYLHGAVLDFEKTVFQSQLVLRNPNARHTCGCGHSFDVAT
jgi:iron-sulfur cluster insertion protein